jgi:cell wall-associated NlpC family hydrolase
LLVLLASETVAYSAPREGARCELEARPSQTRRSIRAEREARDAPMSSLERTLKRTIASWLGTPYRWGMDERRIGADCSGFIKHVLAKTLGVELPRTSRWQFDIGEPVGQDVLQPGDLIFFDTKNTGDVNHVGIYAGKGKFAHASLTKGVVYEDLDRQYFQKAYLGARRIPLDSLPIDRASTATTKKPRTSFELHASL